MQLYKVEVRNFRLLHNVTLLLEPDTTVIVGRNNCGKTSFAEIMKRLLLQENSPSFLLADFSFASHEKFWEAYNKQLEGAEEEEIRNTLPVISVQLTFTYGAEPLGPLSEFVIDIDPGTTSALVSVTYRLMDGKVAELFADLTGTNDDSKVALFTALRERVPRLYECELFAVDPNDATNKKPLTLATLKSACISGFIFAQRGLDDVSHKDRVVIGRVCLCSDRLRASVSTSRPPTLANHLRIRTALKALRTLV